MKALISACFIYSLLIMAGCTSNNGVPNAYPQPAPKTVERAAMGAVGGAAVGSLAMAGSNPSLGAVIGAMLGASVGSYSDSQGAINQLRKQGINVVQLGDIVEVTLPADIFFEPGETEVKRSAYPTLTQVVSLMKQYGDVQISVTGHSDSIGSQADQMALSKLQAQSITTYIWTHGINLNRLHFGGMGSKASNATFNTVYGNGYNRRVEIYFWRKGKPSIFKEYSAG